NNWLSNFTLYKFDAIIKRANLNREEYTMSVPTYDNFIEPVLRVLQQSPTGVAAKEVYEGAANLLHLDDSQRNELIPSGQPVYKNRAGWAHDRLKRAGLSQSLSRGKWCLTEAGFNWLKQHPFPLSKAQVDHLAFDFINVRLTTPTDAVVLDDDGASNHADDLPPPIRLRTG
ncbi:winged helix-turn-helix domain-containing protein, partial [Klebsiella pneumoniae]